MPFTRWQNILVSEAVYAFSPTLIVNHVEKVKQLSSAQKQDVMTFHWRIVLQSLKTYVLLIKFSINLNIKISAKSSSPSVVLNLKITLIASKFRLGCSPMFLSGSVLRIYSGINTDSLNPLTPKSDQHLISPYNIAPESHIKVMRIREMITN